MLPPSMLSLLKFILVLLSTVSPLSFAQSNACPPGWQASASVAGKCYIRIQFQRINDLNTAYVQACREMVLGADALAIRNAFENSEIGSYLKDIGTAYFGLFHLTIDDNNGFYNYYVSYGGGYANDYHASHHYNPVAIEDDGSWTETGGLDVALCQYYPGRPETFPIPLPDCPPGWRAAINVPDKCILYSNVFTDFQSAGIYCRGMHPDAEIITIQNDGEQMPLWDLSKYAWINYARLDGGSWEWIGSVSTSFVPYSLDSSDSGPCSVVRGYDEWWAMYQDEKCDDSYRTVCQVFIRPNTTTTSTTTTTTSTTSTSTTTTTTASTTPATRCPTGPPTYWAGSQIVPGKCYAETNVPASFVLSNSACKALHANASLLAITHDAELGELTTDGFLQPPSQPYWLGLTYVPALEQWVWMSAYGGPIDAWAPGEPQNEGENTCATIVNQTYVTKECSETYTAICQLIVQ